MLWTMNLVTLISIVFTHHLARLCKMRQIWIIIIIIMLDSRKQLFIGNLLAMIHVLRIMQRNILIDMMCKGLCMLMSLGWSTNGLLAGTHFLISYLYIYVYMPSRLRQIQDFKFFRVLNHKHLFFCVCIRFGQIIYMYWWSYSFFYLNVCYDVLLHLFCILLFHRHIILACNPTSEFFFGVEDLSITITFSCTSIYIHRRLRSIQD